MKRVLIIEDEKILRETIAHYFTYEGYDVLTAEDGQEGLNLFTSHDIDVVILDIMLPKIDGWSVCNRIRKISNVPVILLTARSNEADILFGFELGAYDYVTKPFKPAILLARVKRVLNNSIQQTHQQDVIDLCGIHINQSARDISIEGEKVSLTHTEYELLLYLIQHIDKIITREKLMKIILGYDCEGNDQTLNTHMGNLRKKLGQKSKHIITVIRVGYKFKVNP
ncbi:response regulator transcription factor (plasmid) [Bacillus mycoides]|nr:response regulator transcription factor [Bacillus mycoides]